MTDSSHALEQERLYRERGDSYSGTAASNAREDAMMNPPQRPAGPDTRPVARLLPTGKIEIRGYSPESLEFLHSLPDSRFDKLGRRWLCTCTPMAAYRIMLAGKVRIADGDPLADLAWKTTGDVLAAKMVPGSDGLAQPTVRVTDAWRHQREAYHFAKGLPACLLAMGMGTGKSKVAIDLIASWGCSSVLILCPKSVIPVWRREFAKHAGSVDSGWVVECLDREGDTVRRKAARAQEAVDMAHRLNRPYAVIINYDSARAGAFAEWSTETKAGGWDCVIADESHRLKSNSSQQSKYAAKLAKVARHRLCLTGTPLGQSPLDAFGQFRFLDAGVFGTSWFHFSNRYAVKANPHVPQMVTGYRNQEELSQRIGWLTYRCRSEDVLDLPEKHHIDQRFRLTPHGQHVYDDMEAGMIAEVKGGACTAANAMVRLLRLQQITSGYLVPDGGNATDADQFDISKCTALADILDGLDPAEPVVVFCRFRQDLEVVRQLAEESGRQYGELSGARRDALTEMGTLNPLCKLAGVQIAAGGLGVDLTAARYAVFYSLSYSLTEFDQACARVHRPGQTRAVHYYHLVAEDTVDEAVYKALDERREVVEAVLEGLRKVD